MGVRKLKTPEQRRAENLAKISEFSIMDDAFMNAFFSDRPDLVQFILRIILNKENLIVKRSAIQKVFKNLQGRSITIDIDAQDDGKEIDIEFQNGSRKATPKRARMHSSVMDSNALVQREDFSDLPETYVIFITSDDHFKKGLPIYTIDRRINELDIMFGDDQHIIYVNGEYINDTPLGWLIHDFKCKDPNDMHYQNLAKRAKALKETEGGRDTVSDIMEEICKDYAEEICKDYAEEIAIRMILKGKESLEEIAEITGLSLEDVQELAKEVKSVSA